MSVPSRREPAGAKRTLRGVIARTVVRRRPVAVFLGTVFGLAYPLMALVILAGRGDLPGAALASRLGLDLERAASLIMVFLALFPAAVVATAFESGGPGVRALVRGMFRPPIGLVWWAVAVLALPASTICLALLMGDGLRTPTALMLATEVGQAAVAFLLVNLWEEGAWSGFLQVRLEQRHGLVRAALLTAIPFTAIHMPLQIINGNTGPRSLAITFLLLLLLSCVVRLLTGLVRRGAGDRVMAAALVHTAFNRSNNADGIAADLLVGGHRSTAALLGAVLLTAVLGVVIRRRPTTPSRSAPAGNPRTPEA